MKSLLKSISMGGGVKNWLFTFFILSSFFIYRPGIAQEHIPARKNPNEIDSNESAILDRSHIDAKDRNIFLSIECHSGTPPVIEFLFQDIDEIVKSVTFDFESDGQYDLAIEDTKNEVLFRGIPFRQSGTYRTTVYLDTEYGIFKREFIVSFARFVWGKDNFNFANDGKYENAIDFVSKTLLDWAQERFGLLNQDQQALLISVMYSLYIGDIGRCYGFTGEQLYYLNHPSHLPWPHESAYTLRERDEEIMKRIDFVQNDIVFSNYHTGKMNIGEKQDFESLLNQLDRIKQSIDNGRSIIVALINAKMHHSMLVYGYFQNLYRNDITLLTANNWQREQNNNVFSEDAENIVIHLDKVNRYMEWYDITKQKYRIPKKIFAITREDEYPTLYDTFISLLDEAERNIVKEDNILIMVEQTRTAYLIDEEGKRTGYSMSRHFKELEGVTYKKFNYNHIFEIPRDNEYTLTIKNRRYNKELKKYRDVNLFAIIPDGNSIHSELFWNIELEKDSELNFIVGKDFIRVK